MVESYHLPPSSGERPDRFVLVETDSGIRVLSGYNGGYLQGSEWRFSTPIKEAWSKEERKFTLQTESGSVYLLNLANYGFTGLSGNVFESYKSEADLRDLTFNLVSEDTAEEVLKRYIKTP